MLFYIDLTDGKQFLILPEIHFSCVSTHIGVFIRVLIDATSNQVSETGYASKDLLKKSSPSAADFFPRLWAIMKRASFIFLPFQFRSPGKEIFLYQLNVFCLTLSERKNHLLTSSFWHHSGAAFISPTYLILHSLQGTE